ncbi:NADH oxidase [Peptococcaceae bacterium CEB3]|nr:NADH oxidase [Peptococcaceae bacterium CEB3]
MALLLEPLQIKSLMLSNRLIMPPMASSKAEADGRVSREILDHYTERSKGAYLSLIIIEHSYIQAEGKASKNQLSISDDCVTERLEHLADIIHRNGTKCIMQINHAGSAANKEIIGTIPLGPSAVPNPRKGGIPRELTREEIAVIVQAFHDAACRVKNAGFDGVEIHSAHGYLLNQFLSPLTNMRRDDYGGNIRNRIQLHLQVVESIRAAVGNDFPILLRLGASDFAAGGTTVEDSQIAAQEFEKAGVDVLDISGGFCGYSIPGIYGQGYFAPITEAIKQVVSIPVILTGGITEAQAAEQLLADGKADLIGVGRAIYKDSKWAQKAIESICTGDRTESTL